MKLKFTLLFTLYSAFMVTALALPSVYGALLMLAVTMVVAGIAAYYDNKKEHEVSVTIGQKVAVRNSFGIQYGYTVSKVSPSGQVTIERNGVKLRFTPEGYQITSAGFYERARLITTKEQS